MINMEPIVKYKTTKKIEIQWRKLQRLIKDKKLFTTYAACTQNFHPRIINKTNVQFDESEMNLQNKLRT